VSHAPCAGGPALGKKQRRRGLKPALLAAVLVVLALPLAWPSAALAEGQRRLDSVERRVIAKINAYRDRHGLRVLLPARRLARAADEHSRAMLARDFFGHSLPGAETWEERLRDHVPDGQIGEVLAELPVRTRRQASSVVRMWAASSAHRAVLLSPDLGRIGVARRTGKIDGRRLTVYTTDLSA